ncbi:MAG: 50S ribosomal protein L21 [Clostridia bacterium]|jgi:large subunit ribosomal protein L21|nr:50S ribosomal protein L21 [Clostridia bacterium]MDH7574023.1 50S ribosomal protein L21 [Clostridia bacterium]
MYAIIESGGKQYRVREGEVLRLERLAAEEGSTVAAGRVLAVGRGAELRIGQPEVDGVRVWLKVLRHGRGRKILVFKYKPKKNYRRRRGHRQDFTEVRVEKIEA